MHEDPELVTKGVLSSSQVDMICNTYWDRTLTTIRDYGSTSGEKLVEPRAIIRSDNQHVIMELECTLAEGIAAMQWFTDSFNLSGFRDNVILALRTQMVNWSKGDFSVALLVTPNGILRQAA